MEPRRPGPKPKRLYVRIARGDPSDPTERPAPRALREFADNLERVGRLIAHGALTEPRGDALLFRATDMAEARRILRTDPWRGVPDAPYEIFAWDARIAGSGVNLEPAPARGSGRLTALRRVTVVVADQPRATSWYAAVLGFRVREEDPTTGFVELSLARGSAGLSLVAPRPEWGEPYFSEARARIGRATGIVFQTDSASALELRLRHAGARITEPVRPVPWGGRTLRFLDPDGNEFLAYDTPPPSRPDPVATAAGEPGPEVGGRAGGRRRRPVRAPDA